MYVYKLHTSGIPKHLNSKIKSLTLLKKLFSSSDLELTKILTVLEKIATRINNIDSNTAYLTHRSDETLKCLKKLLWEVQKDSPDVPDDVQEQPTLEELDAVSNES